MDSHRVSLGNRGGPGGIKETEQRADDQRKADTGGENTLSERCDAQLFIPAAEKLFFKLFMICLQFRQKNKGCIPEDTPLYYLLATAPIPAPMRMHHILFCQTCLL